MTLPFLFLVVTPPSLSLAPPSLSLAPCLATVADESGEERIFKQEHSFLNFYYADVQQPGITGDKTMDDKLMYIPNYNKQIIPSVE